MCFTTKNKRLRKKTDAPANEPPLTAEHMTWMMHTYSACDWACVIGCGPAPPSSLALSGHPVRKKRLVAPALSLTLSKSDSMDRSLKSEEFSAAALSPSPDDTDLDINLEALETPSDSESCNFPSSMHDLEWEGNQPGRLCQTTVCVCVCVWWTVS